MAGVAKELDLNSDLWIESKHLVLWCWDEQDTRSLLGFRSGKV
jgi:hypothetical protein